MKFKRSIKAQIFILIIIGSTGILIAKFLSLNNDDGDGNKNYANSTIFTISDGRNVFFGNSEDGIRNQRYTKIWFSPAINENTYGCAFLSLMQNESSNGNVGIAIGGINSEGLCFSGNTILPESFVNYVPELGLVASDISYWEIALSECGSVSEVIEWYYGHNVGGWWGNQIHWADKIGDAVIISPTPENRIATTQKSGDFLVSTNFNPVDHSQGTYPCQRYDLVTNRLEDLSKRGDIIRQNLIPILNAVSFPETHDYIGTAYSNIFELKTQTIYLYIQRDFDNEIIFNLNEELQKGAHGYNIPSKDDTKILNRYWALFLSIAFIICIVGIGSFIHYNFKKIFYVNKNLEYIRID